MIDTISTQAQLPGENALVLLREAHYVTETATGLIFRPDTPIEVWGALTERLIRQHKRIEWAIGDALQFGERQYGDTYAQCVEQTGLAENTLATIKWVAGAIESSRRREDVGWSHHREVAPLPPALQDRLLEQAADEGMTRYQVRAASQLLQDEGRGRAIDSDGVPVEPADDLTWRPTKADLVDEARAALEIRLSEMRPSKRSTFEAGFLYGLVYADDLELFKREATER